MTTLRYQLPDDPYVTIEIGEEAFICSRIAGTEWRRFLRAALAEDPGDPKAKLRQELEHAEMLFGLIERHMDDAEFERFDKFCSHHGVGVAMMMQIIQDVVGASSDRPTMPPSPSEPGRTETGIGSTDEPSRTESTSNPSTSPS